MKYKRFALILLIAICLMILWGFTYSTPFGGIKSFLWDMKHRETEKTLIEVEGSGFLDEEHMIVKYGEDVYRTINDEYGENYICRIDQKGIEHPIEGIDNYINEDMAFSWAVSSDEYLIILGESYSRSYFSHEDCTYNNGPMGFYNGAIIVIIDMKEKKIVNEYKVPDGKVVYMDKERYVVMDHEDIRFYQIQTGEIVREEQLEWFEEDREYLVKNHLKEALEFYCFDDEDYELVEKIELK